MIKLTVNGEKRTVDPNATLSELLEDLGVPQKVVMVEANGQVVKRDSFNEHKLQDGDVLELVRLMGGG